MPTIARKTTAEKSAYPRRRACQQLCAARSPGPCNQDNRGIQQGIEPWQPFCNVVASDADAELDEDEAQRDEAMPQHPKKE